MDPNCKPVHACACIQGSYISGVAICNIARKAHDWRTLESLKKSINLNGLPQYVQLVREKEQ
jgi:hypothetical protein